MNLIDVKNLVFEYIRRDKDGEVDGVTRAVNDISMEVSLGDFIAILGHNGSGKSTFAKHLNSILHPTEGTVFVDGMDITDEDRLWDIRKTTGMVFQNPDNQIIGSLVEEDVGFGPENMGVPTKEIWERVYESLKCVGMYEYRKKSPNRLSGGQKQRVTIAGVLAMHPKCIVLDEPTAMLDPIGRDEVLTAVRALNDVEKITIILITHNMDEAVYADMVYVMDNGSVVLKGKPRDVFSQVDRLNELRLSVPEVMKLANELKKRGIPMSQTALSEDEIVEEIYNKDVSLIGGVPNGVSDDMPNGVLGGVSGGVFDGKGSGAKVFGTGAGADFVESGETARHDVEYAAKPAGGQPILIINHLTHIYGDGTAFYTKSLDDITIKIYKGEFIGVIGHTGSGKSTLMQHLNGILKPASGAVYYDGVDISEDDFDLKKLRSKVGLVFQYPEHQLFEADVFSDVCFGPKNLGLEQLEIELRAYEALKAVGISDESFYVSPFDLSGGEKRRVAIAGVLAMKPEILILDEPTAGLDPKGREEILTLIKNLHEEQGITIILVSHSMEDVAEYAGRIIVLDEGRVIFDDTPVNVFKNYDTLNEIGLSTPVSNRILHRLYDKGININTDAITVTDAAANIEEALFNRAGFIRG